LEDVFGLLLLVVYIVGILAISAAITFGVVKLFPTERTPKDPDKSDEGSSKRGGESAGGSLFRRAKREAT
jgi:hypothetical protein